MLFWNRVDINGQLSLTSLEQVLAWTGLPAKTNCTGW